MRTAKGIKPVAPFVHRFDNLYLFGAFSAVTAEAHMLEMPYCNADSFQVFLNHLSTQNTSEFKILVWDNGASHHAKKLQIPFNIALVFLPPYSPELNPVEKMWRYIKDRMSMIAYHNMEQLQQQLSAVTKLITTDIVTSICGNEFYRKTFMRKFNV